VFGSHSGTMGDQLVWLNQPMEAAGIEPAQGFNQAHERPEREQGRVRECARMSLEPDPWVAGVK